MTASDEFIQRIESLLLRAEALLPPPPSPADWSAHDAFRWKTQYVDEEIHPGESVEEKISLSDRFGLWLSFYPFKQEEYLHIVHHWLERLGASTKPLLSMQGV